MTCASQESDLNRLNVIHITGTKGKGSTSAFTDSIIRQVKPDWKVGEKISHLSLIVPLNHRVASVRIIHFTSSRRRPRTHQVKLRTLIRRTVLFILLRCMGQIREEPRGMYRQNLSLLSR